GTTRRSAFLPLVAPFPGTKLQPRQWLQGGLSLETTGKVPSRRFGTGVALCEFHCLLLSRRTSTSEHLTVADGVVQRFARDGLRLLRSCGELAFKLCDAVAGSEAIR